MISKNKGNVNSFINGKWKTKSFINYLLNIYILLILILIVGEKQ